MALLCPGEDPRVHATNVPQHEGECGESEEGMSILESNSFIHSQTLTIGEVR
jgi:hypothetical protein